jgi:hypothetical protein
MDQGQLALASLVSEPHHNKTRDQSDQSSAYTYGIGN